MDIVRIPSYGRRKRLTVLHKLSWACLPLSNTSLCLLGLLDCCQIVKEQQRSALYSNLARNEYVRNMLSIIIMVFFYFGVVVNIKKRKKDFDDRLKLREVNSLVCNDTHPVLVCQTESHFRSTS